MENVLMFVGAKSGGGHVHHTLYYFKYLPMHLAPWTLYAPGALFLAAKRREPRDSFLLCWAGALFVFFSLSRGKRGDYLLPLMPAFALMIGEVWRQDWKDERIAPGWPALLGGIAGVIALVAYPFARHLIPPEIHVGPAVFVAVALASIAPAVAILAGSRRAAMATIAGGVALLTMTVSFTIMPEAQRTRPFAENVARIAGDAPLVQSRGVFDYATLYYLQRRIPTADDATLEKTLANGGFAIVSPEEWRRLSPRLPASIAGVTSDRLLVAGRRR
jgi:4-amino-4-deoxy-L-arabinose transferase-like glycosyltransferase